MGDVVDADARVAAAPRRTPRAIAGERRQVGVLGDVRRVGARSPSRAGTPDAPAGTPSASAASWLATTTAAAMSTSMIDTMCFVYG